VKVYRHATGRWALPIPAKLSATGSRRTEYFSTKEAAESRLKSLLKERDEFGKSSVTPEERDWILLARRQLGSLDLLPEVLQHWKRTGSGCITPILVPEAVRAFEKWQLPRVKQRTASDIRYRLGSFSAAFSDTYLHQLHSGELETWLYGQGAAWSVRSFYKRLLPLFSHAMRHRWIAENPMLLLRAPDVPRAVKSVYSGDQFQSLLFVSDMSEDEYLLPFVALAGFAWLRTSELVRLYAGEDILTWEDLGWKRSRIHVRSTVGKQTRRESGNERWPPMTDYLQNWLSVCRGRSGPVVPVMHDKFAAKMRQLHADANVPIIHNGLRRSAISHYLAAFPQTGIGQLSAWAGTSEATIKRYYLESLPEERGREWFQLGRV
jgi:integrase